MRDFLIDTNIWSYWFDRGREPQHSNVMKRVHELEQTCEGKQATFRVWISAITLGEIEYGYRAQKEKEQSLEAEFRQFIQDISPIVLVVDRHTASEYGRIRGRVFDLLGPKEKRNRLRPEQLIDPISGRELGVDENDLWIVAQAVTRNMTLVSNDKLKRICEVVDDSLNIKNWAAESIS
jgi:predicted nucleic acid-binding protein